MGEQNSLSLHQEDSSGGPEPQAREPLDAGGQGSIGHQGHAGEGFPSTQHGLAPEVSFRAGLPPWSLTASGLCTAVPSAWSTVRSSPGSYSYFLRPRPFLCLLCKAPTLSLCLLPRSPPPGTSASTCLFPSLMVVGCFAPRLQMQLGSLP